MRSKFAAMMKGEACRCRHRGARQHKAADAAAPAEQVANAS
jgi:hypothetical protein